MEKQTQFVSQYCDNIYNSDRKRQRAEMKSKSERSSAIRWWMLHVDGRYNIGKSGEGTGYGARSWPDLHRVAWILHALSSTVRTPLRHPNSHPCADTLTIAYETRGPRERCKNPSKIRTRCVFHPRVSPKFYNVLSTFIRARYFAVSAERAP